MSHYWNYIPTDRVYISFIEWVLLLAIYVWCNILNSHFLICFLHKIQIRRKLLMFCVLYQYITGTLRVYTFFDSYRCLIPALDFTY